jgi:uncharacterized protein YdhG (YjbR/CyaY superfamily)
MAKKRLRPEDGRESVDAYIARCPKGVQGSLREIRSAIREVAPDATETTSYFGIPGYSYPGYNYNGMFAWFSFKETGIGLHLRPPIIEEHAKDLTPYAKTKAIVRFPLDEKIPMPLVKKLVKASLKAMRSP